MKTSISREVVANASTDAGGTYEQDQQYPDAGTVYFPTKIQAVEFMNDKLEPWGFRLKGTDSPGYDYHNLPDGDCMVIIMGMN
jgi:hypothetical protein